MADLGFDLGGGGRGLCQWGRGGGRKSLKVLKVKVKVMFSVLKIHRSAAGCAHPLDPLVLIVCMFFCLHLNATEVSKQNINKLITTVFLGWECVPYSSFGVRVEQRAGPPNT